MGSRSPQGVGTGPQPTTPQGGGFWTLSDVARYVEGLHGSHSGPREGRQTRTADEVSKHKNAIFFETFWVRVPGWFLGTPSSSIGRHFWTQRRSKSEEDLPNPATSAHPSADAAVSRRQCLCPGVSPGVSSRCAPDVPRRPWRIY